jgi:hypothetical protein
MSRRDLIADEHRQAASDVKSVYAELAARPITRNCTRLTECCQFHLTGETPYLTRGEALVAAQAFKATGRRAFPARTDGACPMLEGTKCLIYAARPLGCRTHFCAAAGGPYPRREVSDLIHRLEDIASTLGGSEARPLPAAVQEFLG